VMRPLAALCAIVVAFAVAAAVAGAEQQVQSGSGIDQGAVVAPTATVAIVTPTPSPSPSPEATANPVGDAVATATPAAGTQASVVQPGYGDPTKLPKQARKAELKRACAASHPPTSHLLGLGSVATGRDSGSLIPLGLLIVGAAVAVALAAMLLRHRGGGETPPAGGLEVFSKVLAACATVATLVFAVAPGILSHPAPNASLAVEKVNARITRGDYANLLDVSKEISPAEQRQVGNVVWLRIDLSGFKKSKDLHLRYGVLDLDRVGAGALLPDTSRDVKVNAPKNDTEKLLTPVWLGYPQSHRFRAEFWLLSRDGVQAIASTGKMAGSKYRFACAS
jgi:hypothetical protein